MDKGETALILSSVFNVAMKLEEEYYEEQMTTGQAFSFLVEAVDGQVILKFAGVTLWDSMDYLDTEMTEEIIEKEVREEISKFIETVKAIEHVDSMKGRE